MKLCRNTCPIISLIKTQFQSSGYMEQEKIGLHGLTELDHSNTEMLKRNGHSGASSSSRLTSPNYQRVSKQSDMTDLLSESCGHDWKALPAYYDRSVIAREEKSGPWR
ncbi:unnamed protein product [Pleuronectes platessa]|uniref:Uncharacterized protein n=1 Tax=Pleuronectes platessa TaxID=8262 RepID=A0A9N7UI46_PLEPL|nr:unnamed protein product [Pleuronectes platessa]